MTTASRDAPQVVVHRGPTRGRTGVPFVLLPGIGMSHRYSTRLHNTLARSAAVLSLDLPGFAGVPRPATDRMPVPAYADAIARALESRGLARAVLVGHSMGAQFAVELARSRPELAERIALVAPVVNPRRRTARQQTLDLLRDLVVEPPSGAALVVGDYLRTTPLWFFREVACMVGYDTVAAVTDVRCPVLVVRGENDPIARRAFCQELAAAASGTFVEIAAAGHVVQHSAAEELSQHLLAFAAGASR